MNSELKELVYLHRKLNKLSMERVEKASQEFDNKFRKILSVL